MSVFVMSLVWRYSRADGSALLAALAIADFADDDGRAFPSVATLAQKTRCSERTVQYALAQLRDLGELHIDPGAGPKGCNVYVIRVQNLRGANSAGMQNTTQGGATHCTQTIIEPSVEEEEGERARVAPSNKRSAKTAAGRLSFDFSTGSFVGPIGDHFGRWSDAFPAIDLEAELARAAAWLFANPKNAKSDYLRFLTNWLSRAQDRAPRLACRPNGAQPHGSTRNVTDERIDWWNRATGRAPGPGAYRPEAGPA